MGLRIAIDQDEVLAEFVAGMLKVWNLEHGTDIWRQDVKSWMLEETFGPGTYPAICEVLSRPGFFADLASKPGALSSVRELLAAGHEIVVVTSIEPSIGEQAYAGKREWVAEHLPELDPKDLFFVSRKGWIDADILLDDAVHNIEDWAIGRQRPGGILFDAPWNRGRSASRLFDPRKWGQVVRRACSWSDVMVYIEQIGHEGQRPGKREED